MLGDAVEALDEFKDVEWPPRSAEMKDILDSVPSWLEDGESTTQHSSSNDNDGDNVVGDTNNEDGTEMNKLARDMERKAAISAADNEQSMADTSAASSNGGGDDDTSTVDTFKKLEEELTEANTDDADEVDKLHQEVLDTGKDTNEGEQQQDEEVVKEGDTKESGEESPETDQNNDSAEKALGGNKVAEEDSKKKDSDDDEEEKKKEAAIKRFEAIVQKERPMETPQSPVPPSSTTNKNSKPIKPKVDADTACMEPMHPAVITTLHALCMVISSESKTPKMAEVALECITILTNGRYVSGVAGGRMKLMEQRKLSDVGQGGGGGGSANGGKTTDASEQPQPGHDGRDGGLSFLGYVVESITRASDSSSDSVQTGMAKALLAIMTCPKCGVHEAAMLQAVRSTFHVYLVGKSASGKELAKRTLVDMLKCVFNRMEAYDIISKDMSDGDEGGVAEGKKVIAIASSKSGEDDTTVDTATTTATSNGGSSVVNDDPASSAGLFASQYHTDSYLLFRALCKLSSKTLPGDENVGVPNASTLGSTAMMSNMGAYFSATPTVDPLALNSKILSLELILAVFEHCGDAFRHGEKFVYAVQSYLCVSLLKNCMSNQTVVAHLSLKIFLLLVSLCL